MSNAYRTTKVSVSKSQEDIRKLLRDFGASGVQFGEDFKTGEINVRFAKDLSGHTRTVSVSMRVPEVANKKTREYRRWKNGHWVSYTKTPAERRDQLERATYRAMLEWLKAEFVAIEFGLRSFEDVFLSHFEWMLPNGQMTTVGAIIKPKLVETRPEFMLPSAPGKAEEGVIENEG